MTTFSDSGRVLSEDDIAAFESRTRVRLPEEYRKFLARHNGGVPTPASFSESSVRYFLEIQGRDSYSDIEARWALIGDRLSDGMLPIANDPGGNSILIQTSGADVGSIWFWDHENPSALVRLADSFNRFLDGLTPSEYE